MMGILYLTLKVYSMMGTWHGYTLFNLKGPIQVKVHGFIHQYT
jgi:hypothetical protein